MRGMLYIVYYDSDAIHNYKNCIFSLYYLPLKTTDPSNNEKANYK